MLNYLKKIFIPEPHQKEKISEEKKLQVATCALFIEMAKADSDFSKEEENKIIYIMQTMFNLDDTDISGLIELAKDKTKESISLYEFTTIINESFTNEQKFDMIKNMWRLIYIDEKLDKYEDQLVKRIGGMLNLDFQLIIGAKLMVKEENSKK